MPSIYRVFQKSLRNIDPRRFICSFIYSLLYRHVMRAKQKIRGMLNETKYPQRWQHCRNIDRKKKEKKNASTLFHEASCSSYESLDSIRSIDRSIDRSIVFGRFVRRQVHDCRQAEENVNSNRGVGEHSSRGGVGTLGVTVMPAAVEKLHKKLSCLVIRELFPRRLHSAHRPPTETKTKHFSTSPVKTLRILRAQLALVHICAIRVASSRLSK